MAGKTFHEILKKGTQMRCLDYYGRHPERDGPILVGILIGKFAVSIFSIFSSFDTVKFLQKKKNEFWNFLGVLIGIPISMAIILLYKRGCFGIFGYKPHPNDYTRAFYKRAGLHENLDI